MERLNVNPTIFHVFLAGKFIARVGKSVRQLRWFGPIILPANVSIFETGRRAFFLFPLDSPSILLLGERLRRDESN